MNLIIPNLSMPNNCIECPCYYDGYCRAFEDSKNVDYETDNEKRMDYCPLIPMEIKALEQELIDKSAMMDEIYMEGINMSGEYQGCWVRYKNVKKIVDKYIGDKE